MNSKGFSLLELLVVILITAILASIGISNWNDIKQRNELTDITMNLIRFLNEVKTEANLTNSNLSLFLVTKADNEWCIAVTNKEIPTDCLTKFHFYGNKKITINGLTNATKISFYGRRNNAESGTIELTNSIGTTKIIVSTRERIRYCSNNVFLAGFVEC
ncbi:prepilin-type N-terminal cleavage/methylation domain-containing protein [Orbaceae bacterium ac157xtp]